MVLNLQAVTIKTDVKHWNYKNGSSVYHSRADGLAERAVHTVKRAPQAYSPNLNVLFGVLLLRALIIHRNFLKTWGKTRVELVLGRRVRVPAIADFGLSEPILFKANENTKTVPVTLINRKDSNTFLFSPRTQHGLF